MFPYIYTIFYFHYTCYNHLNTILYTIITLQEDWIGTRVVSYCSLGLLLSSSIWCRKSDPGHGTKIARGLDWYKSCQLLFIRFTSEFLNLVPARVILVMAPKLQEDWIGTRVVSYCSLGLLLSSSSGAARVILVKAPKLQEDWGGTITGNVY